MFGNVIRIGPVYVVNLKIIGIRYGYFNYIFGHKGLEKMLYFDIRGKKMTSCQLSFVYPFENGPKLYI